MNNKLTEFIKNIGALCETWMIAYNSFLGQGLDSKEALTHTQAFMATMFQSTQANLQGGKDDQG